MSYVVRNTSQKVSDLSKWHNKIAYQCITDISLPLSTHDRIAYVHLSPTGRHAVVSTAAADNFYLNLKSNSHKALKRMKVRPPSIQHDENPCFYLIGDFVFRAIDLFRYQYFREM